MAKVHLGCWFIVGFALTAPWCRAGDLSPRDIASLIDERLHVHGEPSVAFADDATVLRRLSLDLIGRIPTIAEVREYLADDSESKRMRTVQSLLRYGAHYKNMATFWRRAWAPQADTPEFASLADGFELWLAHELQQQTRYDRLVAKVVTWDANAPPQGTIDPSGVLPGERIKPRESGGQFDSRFSGDQSGLRPVPQPPVRPLDARAVLANGGVLCRSGSGC